MRVWAIGAQDTLLKLQAFREQMGLTMPVLHDDGAVVHGQYDVGKAATNTVYPQDWIIGVDGTVQYVNNAYEPAVMQAVLDAELAK